MKARGLASPDLGDVLAMTFAVKVATRARSRRELIYRFPDMAQRWMH